MFADEDPARVRLVQATDDIEQGGLAGAGAAPDGDQLTRRSRERDVPHRVHEAIAPPVVAADALHSYQVSHRVVSPLASLEPLSPSWPGRTST